MNDKMKDLVERMDLEEISSGLWLFYEDSTGAKWGEITLFYNEG